VNEPVRPTRPAAWVPIAVIGTLVAARIIAIGVLLHSGVDQEHSILGGDVRRYIEILTTPGTPYRDHAVEYPPLALGFAAIIRQSTVYATIVVVALSQLLLELATAGLLWWGWTRRAAITYLVLGTPMIVFPFPYLRIDLLSVFLTVLGVVFVRRRLEACAGASFAAAVFAKVWPIAIVPILLARRQWRGLVAWTAVVVAGAVAWVAWAGTDGLSQISSFRGAHGWQIESVPGIVAHMVDPHSSTFEQGAWRTGLGMPAWARIALLLASFATIAWAWWAASRARGGASQPAVEANAPLLAVVALLVFAPILSPQYILWMLPFAALATAWGDRLTGWITLAVSALTTFGLATIHAQTRGDLWATIPVAVRNLLLIVLGVHLVIELRHAARDTRPVPTTTSSV
jgi:hypothetical protein